MDPSTLILNRTDIAALMRPADYRAAVEDAFAAFAEGRADCPPPMHVSGADGGGFHVKGAAFAADALRHGERAYAAFKLNANFPDNPLRRGLPTIQGAILLCDGGSGELLAILDSAEVTLQRTAAASAVAAQRLARSDCATLLICGCGAQALAQLLALRDVLPLERALLWDRDRRAAERLAAEVAAAGLAAQPVDDLQAAGQQSDVIVTCTPARAPYLTCAHVRAGTFIAAVGADWPEKNEIAPELMARAVVVVDVLDQCLAMGDLRHAVQVGAMPAGDVRGDLGSLVLGKARGRADGAEITLFDSTGAAIQDVASAAVIYERARERTDLLRLRLNG